MTTIVGIDVSNKRVGISAADEQKPPLYYAIETLPDLLGPVQFWQLALALGVAIELKALPEHERGAALAEMLPRLVSETQHRLRVEADRLSADHRLRLREALAARDGSLPEAEGSPVPQEESALLRPASGLGLTQEHAL